MPINDRADDVADLLLAVYEIHEVIIVETGGLAGLRDPGMLHAAVARPFATFDGQELYPTDLEKAAALFHSLIKSHPFVDGTKRTAFAAALFFLETLGYTFRTTVCATIDAAAFGNGTTDATNAINNAITNCPSGQVVYIPAGNYLITGSLSLQGKALTLRGQGPALT